MRINRVIQTGVVLSASAYMASAGWNGGALGELASYVQSQKTTGFLIIQDGKINGSTYALLPIATSTSRFGCGS